MKIGENYSNSIAVYLYQYISIFNLAFFSTASKYAENDEVVLTKVPDTYDLEFINKMTLRE